MECHGLEINITRDVDCDITDEKIIDSSAKFIVPMNTITLTCGGNFSAKKTKMIPVERKYTPL